MSVASMDWIHSAPSCLKKRLSELRDVPETTLLISAFKEKQELVIQICAPLLLCPAL